LKPQGDGRQTCSDMISFGSSETRLGQKKSPDLAYLDSGEGVKAACDITFIISEQEHDNVSMSSPIELYGNLRW
jgi:hypothetical protein